MYVVIWFAGFIIGGMTMFEIYLWVNESDGN